MFETYTTVREYNTSHSMSDTSRTITSKTKLHKPPDNESWSKRWYFLILPLAPIVPMVIFICVFYNRQSWKWAAKSPEEYLSYDTCNAQDGSMMERLFTIDITYGNYGFAKVKVVDLAWDTLIAQAGRALHVYILYRHVAKKFLICFMEYSSVTYENYIAVIFSRAWWGTLKFFLGRLSRQNKFPISMAIFGFVYLITYTFFFSAIWSAATGYISPAERAYQMPDSTYLPLNSPHLALCWKIDSGRLGLSAGHVELGPDFSMLEPWLYKSSKNGRWSMLEYPDNSPYKAPGNRQLNPARVKRGAAEAYETADKRTSPDEYDAETAFRGWTRTIWDNIGPAGMGLDSPQSSISQDIFSYAFTTRMFQVVFNATGLNFTGYDTPINLNATDALTVIDFTEKNKRVLDVTRENQLPGSMDFYQFHYVNWVNHSQNLGEDIKLFNTWPISTDPDSYVINNTVRARGGTIPYNSTFSFNGTDYSLDAPFLDIGHGCSHPYNYFTALGNCVCYNGEPITYPWYSDDNLVCLDSPRYVWGFSSFMIFLAAILELIWVIFAILIRGYCQWSSQLMKYPRVKRAGFVWEVLEISEAMRRDLGDQDSMTHEKILRECLSRQDRIGYAIDLDSCGVLQGVNIISRSQGTNTTIGRLDKNSTL
ncbi:hypothetical protein G7054_g1881 [Neopestalotiopsis clavispora]|nr:hypothetical protein G7054_g1881 [Neopestalotiopsis clavispora]